MSLNSNPAPPFEDQNMSPPGVEENMPLKPRYKGANYRPADKLKGRTALVTGGDSGIGRSVVYHFVREGARVFFTGTEAEKKDCDALVSEIETDLVDGSVDYCLGDLKDHDFCQTLISQVKDRFGGLDILVNNAAYQFHQSDIDELTIEQFKRCFETNIFSFFYLVKAALPYLKEGSSIINSGSILGYEGNGSLIDYASTKGAIHTFTKSLAQQLIDRGIRVNAVAPGPVWTPLNPAERSAEEIESFGKNVPMERPAQPEEIAPTYVYLASEGDSSYITGEIISLLGGKTKTA